MNADATAVVFPEGLKALAGEIARHPIFGTGAFPAEELVAVFYKAVDMLSGQKLNMKGENGTLSFAHAKQVRTITIADLETAAEALAKETFQVPHADMVGHRWKAFTQAKTPNPLLQSGSMVERFAAAPMQSKISAGLMALTAAYSLMGMYHAARASVTTDEAGQRHVQWSNVGVALLEGLVATGCAYLGHGALRSGGAMARG